jgi:hypothetical protein
MRDERQAPPEEQHRSTRRGRRGGRRYKNRNAHVVQPAAPHIVPSEEIQRIIEELQLVTGTSVFDTQPF